MPDIVGGADLRFGLRPDVAAEVEGAGLLDLAERCYFDVASPFTDAPSAAPSPTTKRLPTRGRRQPLRSRKSIRFGG